MQAAQLVTGILSAAAISGSPGSAGRVPLTRAERVGGYCATLLKYGLPFHSEWVLECESSQKQAAEAMTGLLRQNPTITACCATTTWWPPAWFGLLRAGKTERKMMALRATLSSGWRWRRLPTCRRPPDDLLSPGDHPGAEMEKPGGFDAAAAGRGDWRDAKPDYAPRLVTRK